MKNSPRRLLIQERFDALNISFSFFEGIQGRKDLADSELYSYSEDLSDGEVGCFRSHIAIAEKIAKEKIPYALVFEDDIQIIQLEKFWVQIDWLISLWPVFHWDYVKLFHGISVPKKNVVSKQTPHGLLTLDIQLKRARSTGALLISQEGAEKFYKTAKENFKFEPVDRYLDNIQRSRIKLLVSHLGTLVTDDSLETQTHINFSRKYSKWQKLKNSLGFRFATWKMFRELKKLERLS